MSKSDRSGNTEDDEQTDTEHLERVSDGCGCVEVWENLSEYRQETE